MTRFYQPDLSENIDSPFVRDGANKLVRRHVAAAQRKLREIAVVLTV